MSISRRSVAFVVVGLALFLGWKNLSRAAQEVVVLRVIGVGNEDYFATLWVVDDGHHVWIRAENRQRRWLQRLRANPDVELRGDGRTFAYRAAFFDTAEARAYVDPQFRAKYGFADWALELVGRRDTLPIRLEPR